MTRDLDVLLVHHHSSNPHRPIMLPAMGVLSLTEMLNRVGFRAQAVHMGVESSQDSAFDIVDHARENGVKLVGLSAHWFFQLPDSLAVARAVKEALPHVTTLLGGFSASWFSREIMREHPYIDTVIRGDAEVPLRELCARLGEGGRSSWSQVPNLSFRGADDQVVENSQDYVLDEDEFSRVMVTSVEHLKSRDAFFQMEYYPSRRFAQRFDFKNRGVICLEVGRGCSYTCALCGGNRHAQWKINRRSRPIFQPVDAVIANIRRGMDHGYGNFYLCFDAQGGEAYFKELFQRIRREELDICFMFECWGLPSEPFIDDFRRTFRDGIIVLSPDSGSEQVRDINKGVLSYSNDELVSRLDQIEQAGLVAHVFFGYFQPGDTTESVMTTRRFAHDLESESREVFYLAYSTDPGSIVQTQSSTYEMTVEVKTLAEYLELLTVNRASSNMLAHRPAAMSEQEAARVIVTLNADQLLHRLIPETVRMLAEVNGRDHLHQLMETFLDDLPGSFSEGIRVTALVERFREFASTQALPAVFVEMIDFETRPYLLKERHYSPVGAHYTSVCREVALDDGQVQAMLEAGDAIQESETYQFDLLAHGEALPAGGGGLPEAAGVSYTLIVTRDGAFCRRRC